MSSEREQQSGAAASGRGQGAPGSSPSGSGANGTGANGSSAGGSGAAGNSPSGSGANGTGANGSSAGGSGAAGNSPSGSGPDAPSDGGREAPRHSGLDLARVALQAARERAKERGADARQRRQVREGGGPRSGARRDGRDPLPLGVALERLKAERGWEMPMAVGGVAGRWAEIVGEKNAEHWQPDRYDEESRVLAVRCDEAAWATQLRHMAPDLVRRLNQELGRGTVRAIKVLPPGGGPRRYGSLRVPGTSRRDADGW
ncbi:DciA family protein [Streptomyces sp. XM4193]|uniref:DciA family protein n=1 Tax=Streptomyces sp. XM4193 TaxID=2929782 RepID=UPI001FF72314|nr:DciA family protein [Streptomyces sp. XM4193]MCK1794610.1 DciA family protein [Streptomyces sp. XM4193]